MATQERHILTIVIEGHDVLRTQRAPLLERVGLAADDLAAAWPHPHKAIGGSVDHALLSNPRDRALRHASLVELHCYQARCARMRAQQQVRPALGQHHDGRSEGAQPDDLVIRHLDVVCRPSMALVGLRQQQVATAEAGQHAIRKPDQTHHVVRRGIPCRARQQLTQERAERGVRVRGSRSRDLGQKEEFRGAVRADRGAVDALAVIP